MNGISESNCGTNIEYENENEKPKFVMVLGTINFPLDLDVFFKKKIWKKNIYIFPNSVG